MASPKSLLMTAVVVIAIMAIVNRVPQLRQLTGN